MSAIVFEPLPGAHSSRDNPPSVEIRYLCAGIFDSGVVKASALTLTPTLVAHTSGILFRDDIQVDEQAYGLYHVTVTWVEKSQQKNQPVGNWTFDFTTTGGSLHISHSPYPTHAIYQPSGGAMDKARFKQAIDPEPPDMKPRGTDIVVPVCKLTYTFKHPNGNVNEATARNLARLTGIVNEQPWHGFDDGEVLYIGSDGHDGSNSEAEVKYHMVAQENLVGLTIGAITGIAKQGHDFLWVWWEPTQVADGQSSANQPATKPKAVFIERIYRRAPFATAFGF